MCACVCAPLGAEKMLQKLIFGAVDTKILVGRLLECAFHLPVHGGYRMKAVCKKKKRVKAEAPYRLFRTYFFVR